MGTRHAARNAPLVHLVHALRLSNHINELQPFHCNNSRGNLARGSHSRPVARTRAQKWKLGRGTRRAAHSQYKSKRMEIEVIARKSLKKGGLNFGNEAAGGHPSRPAPTRPAWPGLHAGVARVLFHGSPIFAFYSPTRISRGGSYLRAGKGVRYLRGSGT